MKRVLVHGYLRDNLGDDLFFRVLADRYPDTLFYIPTTRCNYRKKFADLKNVKIIDFCKISRITTHKVYMLPKLYSRLNMSRFDAVVCIGGSLFIDRKNPTPNDRIEAEQYSFICDWEYAQKAGVPYYVIGANWGPCYNDYFFDYFDRAFDSLADLCFRDKSSWNTFSQKPRARCCGDILLDNNMIQSVGREIISRKQIAISVVNPVGKSEENCNAERYYDEIASLCRQYVYQGFEVKLLSFCKEEGDEYAIDQILSRIQEKDHISAVFYQDDWKEVVRILAGSEWIVASRFHATVIGWTVGVPVYSIVYSQKTVHLIEDCGFNRGYVRMENVAGLDWAEVAKDAILPADIKKYSGAETAFARLDQILK